MRSSRRMFHLVAIFAVALLSKCEADLIGDFCLKSNNPTLCTNTLRSDPLSKGADARGLATIAIKKAEEATLASINVAKSISNIGNKGVISTCIENFSNAGANLKECESLINKRDVGTLRSTGSASLTDISTCSDEFGGKEPPQLKEATGKAYTFVQLLLIIANTL
ncbi:pectinesterase inhibitor-like [Salvia divinorum]|uniref:Pectinesterase inhibitor-like n=1 Tax=Salvia divinorum TaxID=28513 RepID=A0ABD1GD13_SALDI